MTLSGENDSYPHDDGYVIVLGPEIFAARDRSVICWQGENYVPQRAHWWRRWPFANWDQFWKAFHEAFWEKASRR